MCVLSCERAGVCSTCITELSTSISLICTEVYLQIERQQCLSVVMTELLWSFVALSNSSLPAFFVVAHRTVPLVGLLLIAFGTGGIKPCVSAFGGDQFGEDQVSDVTSRHVHCYLFTPHYRALEANLYAGAVYHAVKYMYQHCFVV